MNTEIVKAIALIVTASIFAVLLKTNLQEFSFLLVLAVICIVLSSVLQNVMPQVKKLLNIFEESKNSNVFFLTALKVLGISYITSFAASVCRDFGQSALAQTAETVGKCAAFILSIPLICSVMQSALKFVGL